MPKNIEIPPERLAALRAQRDEEPRKKVDREAEAKAVAAARAHRVELAEELGATLATRHLTFEQIEEIATAEDWVIRFQVQCQADLLSLNHKLGAIARRMLPNGLRTDAEASAFARGVRTVYEAVQGSPCVPKPPRGARRG